MLKQLKNRIITNSFFTQNATVITDNNNLMFLFKKHSVGAFLVLPLFALLIYQTELPKIYFYISISYSVLFPVYFILCYYIKSLNNRFIYFFTLHLFLVTLTVFLQLHKAKFPTNELFVFLGFFCLCLIVIQRWFALMLYNIFVFLLLLYGLINVNQLDISTNLIVLLFVVLGIIAALALHTNKNLYNFLYNHNEFLETIISDEKTSYAIVRIDEKIEVINYNENLLHLFTKEDFDKKDLSTSFNALLNKQEINDILDLKKENVYIKSIELKKTGIKKNYLLKVKPIAEKGSFLVIFIDENEKQQLIEDLRLTQKKYDNLYFKNKAGVFTLNIKGELLKNNNSFTEIFEETFQKGDQLFNNKNNEEWNYILDSLNKDGFSKNYQTQIGLKNGKEKNVIFSWYLDELTGNIEGSVIDLTSVQKTSLALKQSEEKYRLIYEETNDAILLLENDKIIDVNRKTTQLFGIVYDELIGKTLFDFSANISDLSKNKYNSNILKLENVKSIKFNWLFKGKNKLIEAEVTLIEITIDKKLYYQCVIHDNTESYSNLRALRKNQRNLENILENNPEGILILSNNIVLYANSSAKKLIGEEVNYQSIFIEADQIQFEKTYIQQQQDTKRKSLQLRVKNEEFLIDVTMVSTNYEEEEATLVILKDISVQNRLDKEKLRAEFAEEVNKQLEKEIKERIKTERLLEEQYLRTKAIIDSSNYTFLLTLNLKGAITSFNKHFAEYISNKFNKELKLEENYKQYFSSIVSETRLETFKTMLKSIKQGKSHKFEVRLEDNKKEYWLEVFMSPIFDTKGNVTEVSLVAHDSSEKKQISINIVESLREKEILLKEIHHRVKNNLQVISSILNLQSSFVTDENTLEILQESRNRIRSMAIIHENLYRTEDFSSINFSSYLENLSANLVASYRINEEVVLKTNLEDVDLVLDQAIPCGLLVNELITNALKYAWKHGEKGVITINLFQEGTQINLQILDDGIGLPFNFYQNKPETLGLQLVETLIEQLDGELDVQIENGTKFFIKFENNKSQINV